MDNYWVFITHMPVVDYPGGCAKESSLLNVLTTDSETRETISLPQCPSSDEVHLQKLG